MARDCTVPEYLPASFKGVPFEVETTSDEFGRRGPVYEYPLSEQGGYKDLGRKMRRYRVSGYVIGGDHVVHPLAVVAAAESPEPGLLMHPSLGPVTVACVTLTTSIAYKAEKRITKLEFDFVEAGQSLAPFLLGAAISAMFAAGSSAVSSSYAGAVWNPTRSTHEAALGVSSALARQISPATDESSYDAVSLLERGFNSANAYQQFAAAAAPLDNGTATVRRIHADAMPRLRQFNSDLVAVGEVEPSIESLVVTARLSLVRDYALTSAQTTYETVKDALGDLDFVMGVYDEEQAVATHRCDDLLIQAIHAGI